MFSVLSMEDSNQLVALLNNVAAPSKIQDLVNHHVSSAGFLNSNYISKCLETRIGEASGRDRTTNADPLGSTRCRAKFR